VTRAARALSALGILAFGILTTACGKKGPPLAPLRIAPAAVTGLSARRVHERVVLRFTLPARNDDNSTPADVARVDVFALTVPKVAEAPAGPAFLETASLLGSVKVTVETGSQASFSEALDQERAAVESGEGPVRVYAVAPVSSKGRRGAAMRVTVPLVEAPPAPAAPLASYSETAVSLTWPGSVPGEGPESGKPLYNVYQADQLPAGSPLNARPFEAPGFEDPRIEFGVERCYVVTALQVVQQTTIESAPSGAACVTPKDTFAPAAPGGLGAVAGPGSVSLIWNAVAATDLAGYLVLRGEGGGDTLQALTPEPISDTTYTDTAVRPGVRYVYAVVAVDESKNLSPQSARVEETAR
jgi:hypothetical protein